MAGVSPFVAPEGGTPDDRGAPAEPLDVRAPAVVQALADAVAILGPDHRPRIMLGPPRRLRRLRAARRPERPDRGVGAPGRLPAGRRRARPEPARTGIDIDARVRVNNEHDGWHVMTLVFRNLLDDPDVQGTVVRAVDQTVFDREARWRTLVGESPIGIFELDLDGDARS